MINFEPKPQHFLVKAEGSQQTAGGIIIPDSAKEKPQSGTIEEVGADCKEAQSVKGGRIMFGKYIGTPIKIEEKEFIVLREKDVLVFL